MLMCSRSSPPGHIDKADFSSQPGPGHGSCKAPPSNVTPNNGVDRPLAHPGMHLVPENMQVPPKTKPPPLGATVQTKPAPKTPLPKQPQMQLLVKGPPPIVFENQEQIRKTYEDSRTSVEDVIRQHDQQSSRYIKSLIERIEELEQQAANFQQRMQAMEAEAARKQEEIKQDFEAALRQKDARIQELDQERQGSMTRMEELEARVKSGEFSLQQAMHRKEELRRQIADHGIAPPPQEFQMDPQAPRQFNMARGFEVGDEVVGVPPGWSQEYDGKVYQCKQHGKITVLWCSDNTSSEMEESQLRLRKRSSSQALQPSQTLQPSQALQPSLTEDNWV